MAWGYKRAITVGTVTSGPHANFPVLFAGGSFLKTVANGGRLTNANGYDVSFYSDANLTTKLDHECEKYSATTGLASYWVRIPSCATGTVFYIAYGDSTITTDQSNKNGVWETNFKGVYHLGDGTTLATTDSTSNANTGSNNSGTATTGEIGGGVAFDGGVNHRITLSTTFGLSGAGSSTVSGWAYRAATGQHGAFLKIGDFTQGWAIGVGPTNSFEATGDGVNMLYEHSRWLSSGVSFGTGWHHFAAVIASGVNKIYLDGAQIYSDTGSAPDGPSGAQSGIGGYQGDGGENRFWNGSLDEIRIAAAARSAGYIATEYAAQSSPGTWLTTGSETALSGGAVFRRTLSQLGTRTGSRQAF